MSKRREHADGVVETSAETTAALAGSRMATYSTILVSLFALVMSGVSLYQTVLKQANLHLFVPDTVAYTRDPNGGYEVLVVPVTIANSGARDGVVSTLRLKVRDLETSREREFRATYFADQGYFSTKENIQTGVSRPKRAFAPITVAGRGSYSATVLFYPRAYSKQRVVRKGGRFDVSLSATVQSVEKVDVVDAFFQTSIAPITFTATLPPVARFFDGQIMTGYSARLFVESKQN